MGSEVQILPGPPPSTPLGVDRNAVYRAFLFLSSLLTSLSFFAYFTYVVHRLRWGCSSAGRAPALQAGGHRFEPVHLHQIRLDLVQNLTLPRFCLSLLSCLFVFLVFLAFLAWFFCAPCCAAPGLKQDHRRREVVPFAAGLSCHSQRRAGDPATLMPRDSGRVFFKL